MLSEYRSLFKYNNYDHFRSFIHGLINTPHRGTMTQIYLSTEQSTTYWPLPKFLSRSKWSVDKLTSVLIRQVQNAFSEGVYVYDETHSINKGLKQFGTHFFRNTRYNTRNKNQSKFNHGHEFGAIGWLCETPQGVRLFPLAARVMCPHKKRDNSFAVLKHLCSMMPQGLIVFDRGFNKRKVFTQILSQGHHLLCRARSNAVFYHIPKPLKKQEVGRPPLYVKRVHIAYLKYKNIVVDDQTLSVSEKIVRTKMCPVPVKLIVLRTRKKPSKPYRYFLLFSSDVERSAAELIQLYRNRWKIETAFRDAKQNFGFDTYQLRNRTGLNRFAQLSFTATCLTQLAFTETTTQTEPDTNINDMAVDLETVLQELNMHWYKAKYITRGLMTTYLRYCSLHKYFSASFDKKQNSKKIREHPT
jgi:hypothetical protein